MFQKKILELLTVVFYWLGVVPAVYTYCKKKNYVESKASIEEFQRYIKTHFVFILSAVIGYVIVYRLVMFAHAKLKVIDKKMWNRVNSPMQQPDKDFRKNGRVYYSKDNVDSVELGRKKGKQRKTTEDTLVSIHVKRETKLGSSAKSEINDVKIDPTLDPYTPIPPEP
ncbi:hypothetical protein KR026_009712, partial [Drosophila bipectinata]